MKDKHNIENSFLFDNKKMLNFDIDLYKLTLIKSIKISNILKFNKKIKACHKFNKLYIKC